MVITLFSRGSSMINKEDFFEDMADTLEGWIKTSSEAMTDESAGLIWTDNEEPFKRLQTVLLKSSAGESDVEQVLSECLRALAISFLVILDGGTPLADKSRVFVVNEDGRHLGEGLHDAFVSYLLETGRLE